MGSNEHPNEKTYKASVRMTRQVYRKLRLTALDRSCTLQALFALAMAEYMRKEGLGEWEDHLA